MHSYVLRTYLSGTSGRRELLSTRKCLRSGERSACRDPFWSSTAASSERWSLLTCIERLFGLYSDFCIGPTDCAALHGGMARIAVGIQNKARLVAYDPLIAASPLTAAYKVCRQRPEASQTQPSGLIAKTYT